MSARQFSADEIAALEQNPNVAAVFPDRILYSSRFKQRAITAYYAGHSPKAIFEEAGFDPALLGYKRIERSISRWSASAPLDALPVPRRPRAASLSALKSLAIMQERRIAKLERELATLLAERREALSHPEIRQMLTRIHKNRQRKVETQTHKENESSKHAKKAR